MTEPVDYQGALEQAVFDRLCQTVNLAKVFQNVPDNELPPVVIIGDIDFEDEGDKGGPLFRYSIQMMAIVSGKSRRVLNKVDAQVHAALNRWRPDPTDEVEFGEMSIETGTGQEVQVTQGTTYFSQKTASVYVWPATQE